MDPTAQPVLVPTPGVHMTAPPIETSKPPPNHPPYAEMIVSAIKALKEKTGSSKKAIAKYINSVYTNLPPSHSALLTHHLKRLKKNGIVLMVKNSYKLPNSTAITSGAPVVVEKRGRGRPPKSNNNTTTTVVGVTTLPVSGSPVVKRGRGRPSKVIKPKPIKAVGSGLVKKGRGRPPKISKPNITAGPADVVVVIKPKAIKAVGSGLAKRGRGRPPKISKPNITSGPADVVVVPVSSSGEKKGRGRPKKNIPTVISVLSVGSGEMVVPSVISKPRGRPRKVGGGSGGPPKPKKVKVSTGRPVGRPKKVATPAPVTVSVPTSVTVSAPATVSVPAPAPVTVSVPAPVPNAE